MDSSPKRPSEDKGRFDTPLRKTESYPTYFLIVSLGVV